MRVKLCLRLVSLRDWLAFYLAYHLPDAFRNAHDDDERQDDADLTVTISCLHCSATLHEPCTDAQDHGNSQSSAFRVIEAEPLADWTISRAFGNRIRLLSFVTSCVEADLTFPSFQSFPSLIPRKTQQRGMQKRDAANKTEYKAPLVHSELPCSRWHHGIRRRCRCNGCHRLPACDLWFRFAKPGNFLLSDFSRSHRSLRWRNRRCLGWHVVGDSQWKSQMGNRHLGRNLFRLPAGSDV